MRIGGLRILCTALLMGAASAAFTWASQAPAIGARVLPAPTSQQHKAIKKLELTLCKKLAACRPEALRARDCRRAVKETDDFLHTVPSGVFSASRKKIRTCTKGIKRASCAELFSDIPPEGCEFFR